MEILAQLGINNGFFWMLALYLGSFALAYFFGLGDVCKMVIERHQRIVGRSEKAQHLKHELQKIQDELSQHMKRAKIEAQEAFLTLRNKAIKEQKNILSDAREKTAIEIKAVRASVQEQTSLELKKLEQEVPQMAKLIVDQIMSGSNVVTRQKQNELRG